MEHTELIEAYADGTRDFRGAYLSGAYLSGANLSGANLGGANLSGTNLSGAYLGGANLGGADLGGANLGGANLGGANLSRANLSRADLYGAYLSRANLSGADLSRADLSGTNLGEGVRLHDSGVWTRLPPRCSAGDWHAICVAPSWVTIGCTTMRVIDWLDRPGEDLADENGVTWVDRKTFGAWLAALKRLGPNLPGWVPDKPSKT